MVMMVNNTNNNIFLYYDEKKRILNVNRPNSPVLGWFRKLSPRSQNRKSYGQVAETGPLYRIGAFGQKIIS